jgi:hypothetical protein
MFKNNSLKNNNWRLFYMDMKMDVKDLFAKMKKGGSSGSSGGGITAFLEKNPAMKVIVPVVLIVLAAAISLLIILGTNKAEVDKSEIKVQSQNVYALPQQYFPQGDEKQGDTVGDIALEHPRLTAIYDMGRPVVTIETDNGSYTYLEVGEKIGDSDWSVYEVKDNSVILACEDGESTQYIELVLEDK